MPSNQVLSGLVALLVAALLAAFLAALPFALLFGLHQLAFALQVAFVICLGHAILLGLPLVLVLDAAGRLNRLSSTLGGFLVGAAGMLILSFGPFEWSLSDDGILARVGFVAVLARGIGPATALFGGLLGALAGLTFWAVIGAAQAPSAPKAARGAFRASAGLAAAAAVAAGLMLNLPEVTTDRSCHNKYRDANTAGAALTRVDLAIMLDDWPKLIQLFQGFATSHALAFRNSGQNEFGERRVMALSLCNEAGARIEAGQDRWAAGIGIEIRQLPDGTNSPSLADALVADLDRLWPGATQFRDAQGRLPSER